MGTKTYKVHLTKPWQLLALVFSTIGLFFITNYILQKFDLNLIGVIFALILSTAYFLILKRLLIHNTSLGLNKNEIILGDRRLKLNDIAKYKTHRMRGVGLTFKLKDGDTLRLSSNDNFCNSDELLRFVNDLEEELTDKPEIKKVKTFGESKLGLYFAISATIILVSIIIFKKINGEGLEFTRLAMILAGLSTLWSGIEIRKTFANKL